MDTKIHAYHNDLKQALLIISTTEKYGNTNKKIIFINFSIGINKQDIHKILV